MRLLKFTAIMEVNEVWEFIPGYEGFYQVSNFGNVRSVDRFVNSINGSSRLLKGRLLVKYKNQKGYLSVCLKVNNKQRTKLVHQLVAKTFLNHKANGNKKVVDHINHDKSDNRVENLRVVSQRENLSNRKNKYTSEYTGVSWCKSCNKWVSSIGINGKKKTLGRFENEIDAHLKYQEKLKELKSEKV